MKTLYFLCCTCVVLSVAYPTTFDLRVEESACVPEIRSKDAHCDLSNVTASVDALSVSFCYASSSKYPTLANLSVTYPNFCGDLCPSDLLGVWDFLAANGTTLVNCYTTPMSLAQCNSEVCAFNKRPTNWVYLGRSWQLSSIDSIKTAIYQYGAVVAAIDKTQDAFINYNGGILTCPDQYPDPSSLVYLIGWDTHNNTSFWIGANNWGTNWGKNGYFTIEMGTNTCGIESFVYLLSPRELSNCGHKCKTSYDCLGGTCNTCNRQSTCS